MTGPVRPFTGMQPGTQPGQNGQQQPAVHPTVGNLGMPGAPVTVLPPNAPFQGGHQQMPQRPQQQQWQMPPAPQQQNQTFQDPQQQGQQQGWQGTPAQPPANQAPMQQQQPARQQVNLPDNVILEGEGVPVELRGRTWGQAKQIFSALSTDFVNRQQQRAPQQQQAPVQQQTPQQGPPMMGGRPRTSDAASDFWSDPAGAIARVVDERVSQHLAPVTQRTAAMAAQEARNIAAQGIADFQVIEAEVIRNLQGVTPDMLADPRVWQNAADLARGRMMAQGTYQPPQQQPGQQIPVQQQRGPGAFVPAPAAPIGAFFTEAPTPPNQQSAVNSITPEEQYYAKMMGMSDQDYVAWRGGVVQTASARRF